MSFPAHRKRRLRVSEAMRRLVRETHLEPSQFVLPLFVCPGEGIRRPIGSMPGNAQFSVDQLVKECEEVQSLGIGGVMLFGIPKPRMNTRPEPTPTTALPSRPCGPSRPRRGS